MIIGIDFGITNTDIVAHKENTYDFFSVKSEKFDETIDISVKLGVDSNKSDQNVRGAVTLPNSLGKDVTVAVFADGDGAS